MPRRSIVRRTRGKEPIKKSVTLLANIGAGSTVTELDIIVVPDRSAGGATTTIIDNQTTGSTANVGNVIKYVNLCIEAGNRNDTPNPASSQDNGWIEWAVGFVKENDVSLAVTNLGTQTLADIATKTLRGNCLMTGCIPVGAIQPITQDIRIKVPKTMVKLQLGSSLKLYTAFRSINSADVRTDNCRIIMSALYKLYV